MFSVTLTKGYLVKKLSTYNQLFFLLIVGLEVVTLYKLYILISTFFFTQIFYVKSFDW